MNDLRTRTAETNSTAGMPTYAELCAQRRLILVDIENAARGPKMTVAQVRMLRTEITESLDLTLWDQVIVGCSHIAMVNAKAGWPRARVVVRSGPDGADLALLAELGHIDVRRFAGLVLVSGDHLFAPAISTAALPTTVLGHRDGLSQRLRLAATHVRYLSTEHPAAA